MIVYPGFRLEAICQFNVSTRQPHVHVDYVDYGPTGQPAFPYSSTMPLNGSTAPVIMLSAPATGQTKVREVQELTIYNDDTGNVSVAIGTSDGTTRRLFLSTQITSSKALSYTKQFGWQFNI